MPARIRHCAAAMACLRAIEVSSEVSAEISGTPRRTCTGSRRPRGAAPSRRRRRPSASAATGGCGAPPRPRRARGARVARRRLRRCRPASYRNSRARGRPRAPRPRERAMPAPPPRPRPPPTRGPRRRRRRGSANSGVARAGPGGVPKLPNPAARTDQETGLSKCSIGLDRIYH